MDVEQRLWRKVDRSGGPAACWLWLGTLNGKGYGRLVIGSRRVAAHRVSYTIANGEVPDGLQVRHRCDNRACVNPAHLVVGTNIDNVRDRMMRTIPVRCCQHGRPCALARLR